MTWSVDNAEALEWLKAQPARSVDCVATDPPYGINTKSDGMGKLNPWADLTNAALWYEAWIGEARRVLRPTGCLWSCLNWRSLPTFMKAACDLRWPIESVLVWNKDWIGPGGPKGLRPAYELVALWAMPQFRIADRSVPDVLTVPWCGTKPTGHPAEKPVALFEFLLAHSLPKPGVVADPFAGSGTTALAALALGHEFKGCEIDPVWRKSAVARISPATAPGALFEETP